MADFKDIKLEKFLKSKIKNTKITKELDSEKQKEEK